MKIRAFLLALACAALPLRAHAADDFCNRLIVQAVSQLCQLLPSGLNLCQPVALVGPGSECGTPGRQALVPVGRPTLLPPWTAAASPTPATLTQDRPRTPLPGPAPTITTVFAAPVHTVTPVAEPAAVVAAQALATPVLPAPVVVASTPANPPPPKAAQAAPAAQPRASAVIVNAEISERATQAAAPTPAAIMPIIPTPAPAAPATVMALAPRPPEPSPTIAPPPKAAQVAPAAQPQASAAIVDAAISERATKTAAPIPAAIIPVVPTPVPAAAPASVTALAPRPMIAPPPETVMAPSPPVLPGPMPARVGATEKETTLVVDALAHFDFDSANLTRVGRAALDAWLRTAPKYKTVHISGHADRLGPDPYNLKLSQRRAEAVKRYLVDKGLNPRHIQIEARGAANQVKRCKGRATPATKACLAPNRRAVVDPK